MTEYPELPDELHELEQSIYDCKNVIYDIKKSEKYADNLDEALDAIKTLYEVKFAECISRFNEMERKYIGLHESWHDMNPLLSEEESDKRMDIIGQNGNDGLHYKYEDDAVSFIEEQYPETAKEFKKIQEERTDTFEAQKELQEDDVSAQDLVDYHDDIETGKTLDFKFKK